MVRVHVDEGFVNVLMRKESNTVSRQEERAVPVVQNVLDDIDADHVHELEGSHRVAGTVLHRQIHILEGRVT